jgi:hypothetical protein
MISRDGEWRAHTGTNTHVKAIKHWRQGFAPREPYGAYRPQGGRSTRIVFIEVVAARLRGCHEGRPALSGASCGRGQRRRDVASSPSRYLRLTYGRYKDLKKPKWNPPVSV